ncbi:hypothetical protein [Sulfurovum sp.]|uniref:hypothetical protein n=1 Tax=Sulfurovum sp. TaxID=1969726 RepID=UPI002867DE5B|nr:hypothetical protein [Sulfurovum sp.]
MERITIKTYAIKHKLSMFNVVKMIKSGQIPTENVLEKGKDVVYVVIDKDIEDKIIKTVVPEEKREPYGLRKENTLLKKEIEKLKLEIATLKNKV